MFLFSTSIRIFFKRLEKKWFDKDGTTKAIVFVVFFNIEISCFSKSYITEKTFALVFSPIPFLLFKTLETVEVETLHKFAISSKVIIFPPYSYLMT